MRWLIAFWFALASALNPALAALTVNNLTGFNARAASVAAPASASVVLQGCTYSSSNLTTFTFASQNLGAVTVDGLSRYLVVGVMAEDTNSSYNISSATVNGSSPTIVSSTMAPTTAYTNYLISGASGTSGDIVVTFSEAVTSAAICVWSLYGFSPSGFATILTDSDTGGAAIGPSAYAASDDLFIVGVCAASTVSTGLTWGAGFTTSLRIPEAEMVIGYGYTFPSVAGTLDLTCDAGGGDVSGRWLYATPL